ncbi:hypothetical protein AMAG_13184 [Allomyces macrogynus ATCC 38327]|uniref:G-protein coupled receptors family 2 profile 2 domain-containing protein n=1 Tax=Allomyces macrogynus (strain ATCC 38327) TaxID=578462 RepID=A0A0L0T0A7_ALLM3|nr:hypothetical protein AMAG_13184 [Allomyces macrogynus ATCC 38327]|eukprot:KNE68009.1 hypothetical protein AMAG_13184 [Allomyces macrogynus ATCC 38327]
MAYRLNHPAGGAPTAVRISLPSPPLSVRGIPSTTHHLGPASGRPCINRIGPTRTCPELVSAHRRNPTAARRPTRSPHPRQRATRHDALLTLSSTRHDAHQSHPSFTMTAFTESEVHAMALAAQISGVVSLLSTLAILGDYLYRRSKGTAATSSSRIILWWTLTDLMSAPGMIVSRAFIPAAGELPSALCQFQGVITPFAYLSSAFWAMLMAATSYLAVCWRWSLRDIVKMEKTWFHVFAWGVPLALTIMPIFIATGNAPVTGVPAPLFGDAVYYCWISPAWAPYRMYFFYIPIMVCFFLNVLMFVRAGVEIFRVFNEANTMGKVSSTPRARFHARHRFAFKCAMYLGVFVLVYGFALANRLEALIHPDKPIFALALLQGILLPLKGGLNAIVYFSSHIMARAGGVLYHSGDSTDGSSGQTGASASASQSATHSRAELGLASRTGAGSAMPLHGSVPSSTGYLRNGGAVPPASPVVARWPESDVKNGPMGGGFDKPPRPTYNGPQSPTTGSGRGPQSGQRDPPTYW